MKFKNGIEIKEIETDHYSATHQLLKETTKFWNRYRCWTKEKDGCWNSGESNLIRIRINLKFEIQRIPLQINHENRCG
jgi:hypothetical protein